MSQGKVTRTIQGKREIRVNKQKESLEQSKYSKYKITQEKGSIEYSFLRAFQKT